MQLVFHTEMVTLWLLLLKEGPYLLMGIRF